MVLSFLVVWSGTDFYCFCSLAAAYRRQTVLRLVDIRTSVFFSTVHRRSICPSAHVHFGRVLARAVRANTVTNVMVMATNWDLQTDAGCGDAGCDPRLTRVSVITAFQHCCD